MARLSLSPSFASFILLCAAIIAVLPYFKEGPQMATGASVPLAALKQDCVCAPIPLSIDSPGSLSEESRSIVTGKTRYIRVHCACIN